MSLQSFDLTKLDTKTFEHLANALALKVLGAGHMMFGPGKDGGRDGYFEGSAPYPSATECWSGRWYLQAKFHAPNLSKDHNSWLVEQISAEIGEFTKPHSTRIWPDNMIVVTNIEPSGVPTTGAFDKSLDLIAKVNPALSTRFHIWGGQKVIELLSALADIQRAYFAYIAPSHVLSALYASSTESRASRKTIIQHLIVKKFSDQIYTKLDQVGSTNETRPSIQTLFVDLPYSSGHTTRHGLVADDVSSALAERHGEIAFPADDSWSKWKNDPKRARSWFIKGGPGQRKSTITQFIAQVNRAAILLSENAPTVKVQITSQAQDVKEKRRRWPYGR